MRSLPLLYSFRRCPYAIRARMALLASGVRVELREVRLAALPAEMLRLSPKATVPVMQLPDGQLLDESIDVMRWCLAQSDPLGWLLADERSGDWIRRNDYEFKPLLDHYKYADRHPQLSRCQHRERTRPFLGDLEIRLCQHRFLVADRFSLADAALLPFVRQFAGVEPDWFAQCDYAALRRWLSDTLDSDSFARVMQKYKVWQPAAAPVYF